MRPDRRPFKAISSNSFSNTGSCVASKAVTSICTRAGVVVAMVCVFRSRLWLRLASRMVFFKEEATCNDFLVFFFFFFFWLELLLLLFFVSSFTKSAAWTTWVVTLIRCGGSFWFPWLLFDDDDDDAIVFFMLLLLLFLVVVAVIRDGSFVFCNTPLLVCGLILRSPRTARSLVLESSTSSPSLT